MRDSLGGFQAIMKRSDPTALIGDCCEGFYRMQIMIAVFQSNPPTALIINGMRTFFDTRS